MIDIEWPCPNCDQPFASDTLMEEHRKTCKGGEPALPKVTPAPKKKVEPTVVTTPPIELTYQYKGKCFGGHPLDTLYISTKKKNKVVVVAYCSTCHKQFDERVVEKL